MQDWLNLNPNRLGISTRLYVFVCRSFHPSSSTFFTAISDNRLVMRRLCVHRLFWLTHECLQNHLRNSLKFFLPDSQLSTWFLRFNVEACAWLVSASILRWFRGNKYSSPTQKLNVSVVSIGLQIFIEISINLMPIQIQFRCIPNLNPCSRSVFFHFASWVHASEQHSRLFIFQNRRKFVCEKFSVWRF